MNALFLKIINMSISASWLVLAVLVLRVILKKAPKWINVLLWGIVAVRLIFPFSFESALSLIPSAETIPLDIGMAATPTINSGINVINHAVNPVISQSNTPMTGASVNPLQITISICEIIWMVGMAILALYTIISCWRLIRKIDTAVLYKNNIFQSENVSSPFVLGFIKPRIYVPFRINDQDLEYVVAHEQAHIRRKDHLWKPLGFLLLTIHWFNPLMWLAYVLLCRDIELACDEKVIKELGSEQRADYSQALVTCSVNRRMIAACPIAFGEVGVKERVKSVLHYKKPAVWITIAATVVCIIVAICFLTNPSKNAEEIELADLDGDGALEQLIIEELTPNECYTVRFIREDGSELWSAELGLPNTEWDSYFLYQDGDVNGILHYTPTVYQGYAEYFYELYTFPNGIQTTYAAKRTMFNLNSDSEEPGVVEATSFAEEVNALLAHSTLLISTLDGELHQYGDSEIEWVCELPISEDAIYAVPVSELMGLDCWYTEEITTPSFFGRTYFSQISGSDTSFIVAESFGYEIDDYIVDLDGDGISELVCNCQYGDGAQEVFVYRRNGDQIERGYIELEEDWLGQIMPDWKNKSILCIVRKYNAETGKFEVGYDTENGFEAAGVIWLEDFKFEKYAEVLRQEQTQAAITAENLFASMPRVFHFLSGAGGWRTELFWNGDGTFTGIHEDTDAGVVYRCDFEGNMELPEKIGDLEFSTHLTVLNSNETNTVAYEDGIRLCGEI